jgi:hypothetical protein
MSLWREKGKTLFIECCPISEKKMLPFAKFPGFALCLSGKTVDGT